MVLSLKVKGMEIRSAYHHAFRTPASLRGLLGPYMALVLRRENKSVIQASKLMVCSGRSTSISEKCSTSSLKNAVFMSLSS